MHAADTSLSVETAVDVAREAADFVLLERNLDVIRGGIEEGRRTFANTLKYILTTTSANLGNMASMAAASLFLPFLPLTGRDRFSLIISFPTSQQSELRMMASIRSLWISRGGGTSVSLAVS